MKSAQESERIQALHRVESYRKNPVNLGPLNHGRTLFSSFDFNNTALSKIRLFLI
jgi:hypothetical protein